MWKKLIRCRYFDMLYLNIYSLNQSRAIANYYLSDLLLSDSSISVSVHPASSNMN